MITTRAKKAKKLPLVTVLIPVYNGTKFLNEAIRSVLKSSYKNYEIVLVDDGSTDTSKEKCLKFASTLHHVSYYGFKKNKGMTRCLNFGVKKAKGKYIARLNQDDIMMPDRLAKQVTFLEQNHDYVIVGGAVQLFTDENPHFDTLIFPHSDEQIRRQWMLFSPYSDPAVMYRKDAWKKTEGYSQYFWPADDVHMWYQLGLIGKLANLDSVLTKVRWHEACGSLKSHRLQIKKTWQVHNWAAEMIQKPTFSERIFWYGQLFAGTFFSPRFNWYIYRILRKIQHFIFQHHYQGVLIPRITWKKLPKLAFSK